MLPRFCGLDRPGDVEVIREGIVDRVDFRIGEQLFIGAIRLRNTQPFALLLRLTQISVGECQNISCLA